MKLTVSTVFQKKFKYFQPYFNLLLEFGFCDYSSANDRDVSLRPYIQHIEKQGKQESGDHDLNVRNPLQERFKKLSKLREAALSVIGQVMFYDIWILHRTVDVLPRPDLGVTEQEVGEHLLVLVPVQSCFAVLKRKVPSACANNLHPNLPESSLTHSLTMVISW